VTVSIWPLKSTGLFKGLAPDLTKTKQRYIFLLTMQGSQAIFSINLFIFGVFVIKFTRTMVKI